MGTNDTDRGAWALAQEAAACLRNWDECRDPPLIGIVTGSGLDGIVGMLEDQRTKPYLEIPHFPVSTVNGHQNVLVVGMVGIVRVVVLRGRVHPYEGFTPRQTVHAVRTLAAWGCKAVVLTNASGCVQRTWKPGRPMVITDHNALFMGASPFDGPVDGPWERFPDMGRAYNTDFVHIMMAKFEELGVVCHQGVYAGRRGPCYETQAEADALATMGCGAVGMSTVHEAEALYALGVRVAGISAMVSWGGVAEDGTELKHEDVARIASQIGEQIGGMLKLAIPVMAALLHRNMT